LNSCSDLECISITKRMFIVNQMQALLYRKKWRNIKKIVLHAGYGDTISNEDYILRLVENMDLVTSSPEVCLCDNAVMEYTKTILRRFLIVCDCGVRVKY